MGVGLVWMMMGWWFNSINLKKRVEGLEETPIFVVMSCEVTCC